MRFSISQSISCHGQEGTMRMRQNAVTVRRGKSERTPRTCWCGALQENLPINSVARLRLRNGAKKEVIGPTRDSADTDFIDQTYQIGPAAAEGQYRGTCDVTG